MCIKLNQSFLNVEINKKKYEIIIKIKKIAVIKHNIIYKNKEENKNLIQKKLLQDAYVFTMIKKRVVEVIKKKKKKIFLLAISCKYEKHTFLKYLPARKDCPYYRRDRRLRCKRKCVLFRYYYARFRLWRPRDVLLKTRNKLMHSVIVSIHTLFINC